MVNNYEDSFEAIDIHFTILQEVLSKDEILHHIVYWDKSATICVEKLAAYKMGLYHNYLGQELEVGVIINSELYHIPVFPAFDIFLDEIIGLCSKINYRCSRQNDGSVLIINDQVKFRLHILLGREKAPRMLIHKSNQSEVIVKQYWLTEEIIEQYSKEQTDNARSLLQKKYANTRTYGSSDEFPSDNLIIAVVWISNVYQTSIQGAFEMISKAKEGKDHLNLCLLASSETHWNFESYSAFFNH